MPEKVVDGALPSVGTGECVLHALRAMEPETIRACYGIDVHRKGCTAADVYTNEGDVAPLDAAIAMWWQAGWP